MAIVGFTFDRNDVPADAIIYHVEDARNSMSADTYGPRPMWLYKQQIGKCLVEREQNGYNDSDFFMTYWDEEKNEPVTVMFATTRGWTYPCLASSVDATPDVVAKYEAWKAKKAAEYRVQQRKAKATAKRELRNKLLSIANEYQVSYPRLLKLRKMTGFEGMVSLFNNRLRSNFKISMRNQLINWLNNNSKYDRPFSAKQMQYL